MEQNMQDKNMKDETIQHNKVQSEEALGRMLKALYAGETAPRDVNIRLQNQIKCKEVMEESGLHIWWLPASLSTIIAAAGIGISVLLYCIVNLVGMDATMPYLLQFVTGGFLKIHLALAACQVIASWLITLVGLWKLNFYQSARL